MFSHYWGLSNYERLNELHDEFLNLDKNWRLMRWILKLLANN